MKSEFDWNKLGRYFAGECSNDEREEIDSWIVKDPEAAAMIDEMRRIWEAAGQKLNKWDVDRAWSELSAKAGLERSYVPRSSIVRSAEERGSSAHFFAGKNFWRAAAIITVFLGVRYLAIQFKESQEAASRNPSMREISAEKGQRISFKFEDGTKVTLNAASILRFPDHFNRERREVYLEGEALFEATRRNGVPFVVKAEGAMIEVLGTRFSVKAWPGESGVQVVVAEGKVSLRTEKGDASKRVILTRGQMCSMSETGEFSLPLSVDVDREIAWVSGRLLFDKTPFRDAVKSLERKYNIVCLLPDTTVLSRRLTATFKDESTDAVLKMISLSLDLRYRRDLDTVKFLNNERRRHAKEL